jgi:hypothetical protein
MRLQHADGAVTVNDPEHGEYSTDEDGIIEVPEALGRQLARFPGWSEYTGPDDAHVVTVGLDPELEQLLAQAGERIADLEEQLGEVTAERDAALAAIAGLKAQPGGAPAAPFDIAGASKPQLVVKATELGIPAKGKTEELRAAVAAKLAAQAPATPGA